jgi:hypothetical protein
MIGIQVGLWVAGVFAGLIFLGGAIAKMRDGKDIQAQALTLMLIAFVLAFGFLGLLLK